MSAIIVDGGKQLMLKLKVGLSTINLSNALFHLFTNNVSPTHSDTLGTYTEAAWTGYAAQVAGGWSAPTLDGTFHATTTGGLMTFTNPSGSSQSVYGYFVTDNPKTTLVFVERFTGAPLTIPNGMTLTVTPTITDQSEF
jgi:hypothetical protein